jgi:hypothetical protein
VISSLLTFLKQDKLLAEYIFGILYAYDNLMFRLGKTKPYLKKGSLTRL